MNNIRPYHDRSPHYDDTVFIDPTAVVIGDVTIGRDSSVWPLVAIRGDVNFIEIGARSNVQDGSILHVARPTPDNPHGYPLRIGDDVTIGHGAILHACTIGNRTLIGMGSTVLDGAVLEEDLLLAAGSLVPPGKRLTAGQLWRGSPATAIRQLKPTEIEWLHESAKHYVRLKGDYLGTGSSPPSCQG